MECLESFGEVVGSDEVAEVDTQLVVGVVVVALYRASLMVRFMRSTCPFARVVNCTAIGECSKTFPSYSSFSSMARTRV